jgi:hypothetical protein
LLEEDVRKTIEKDNIFEKSSKKAEIPLRNLSFYIYTQLLKTGLYMTKAPRRELCLLV